MGTSIRREPLTLALGIVAIYTAIAAMVLATHNGDPKAFVVEKPNDVPFDQAFAIGYDGQFSYAIAVDPIGASESGALDRPAYRYMRIAYPIAARIAALGIPNLIPWSLLAVNILVAGATAWFFSSLIGQKAGAVWPVFALLLSINYFIGIRFDLNEPLALLAAIAGLWLHKQKSIGAAAGAFALSGLTKEVFLVFPLAVAIYEATHQNFRSASIILLGSFLPYFAWSAVIAQWQGTSPFSYSLSKPSLIPFAGIRNLRLFESQVMVLIWGIGPTVLVFVVAIWKSVRELPRRPSLASWLVLLNVLALATIPAESWADPLAVLRLALGAMAAGLLWLSQVKPRILPFSAALWIPSLLIAFILPGLLF